MTLPKHKIWNPYGKIFLYDIENVYECLMQQKVFDKSQESRGTTPRYNHAEDGMEWLSFTGLSDKNGNETYEGDIIQFYRLAIEHQTHEGNNIPNGSYTEPCGILASKCVKEVVFVAPKFTTAIPEMVEEDGQFFNYNHEVCPLSYPLIYSRKELDKIFWPRPYGRDHEVLSDEEFLETCKDVSKDLGFECNTIDEFIKGINGFKVIGNRFENPELLPTP